MPDNFSNLIAFGRTIIGQSDFPTLFKNVVDISCETLNAEGGTFYLYEEEGHKLEAVVAINQTCNIDHALTEFNPSNITGLFSVQLARDKNKPQASISGECFRTHKPVIIPDIGSETVFELQSVKDFDEQHNYVTKSILAIPLLNHSEQVLGVLQLVNVKGIDDKSSLQMLETIASFIGMALENSMLRIGTEQLFTSVVAMISSAIDERSKETGGHSSRVTALTMMMAEAMDEAETGPYKDVNFSQRELVELKVAALLHDVGKLSTPDYVLEKSHKLLEVSDRVEYLRLRFHIHELEQRIAQLQKPQAASDEKISAKGSNELQDESDFQFINQLNAGGEFLSEESRERLEEIAQRPCMASQLIERRELENLRIARGTLNSREIQVMRNHVTVSYDLLSKLPWPKHYAEVPEIAGKHHENINGTGYPNGITGDDMSLRAKILSFTDRFEGLSAPDRSYRKAKNLDEVMDIMEKMCGANEIDWQLYRFFIESKVLECYSKEYLSASQ